MYNGYKAFILGMTVGICGLLSSAHGSPAHINQIRSIQRRAVDPANLDILVPVGDQLERDAVTAQSEAPQPGDVTAIGDGKCSPGFLCSSFSGKFCTVQTVAVYGDVKQVSSDISCTTPTCGTSKSQAFSVQSTNALTIGLTGSADVNSAIKGQANIGWTHTWSDTIQQTSTYSFNPVEGDRGHSESSFFFECSEPLLKVYCVRLVIFIPYMLETCGSYTKYVEDIYCDTATAFEPMACRQTPYRINEGLHAEMAGVRVLLLGTLLKIVT